MGAADFDPQLVARQVEHLHIQQALRDQFPYSLARLGQRPVRQQLPTLHAVLQPGIQQAGVDGLPPFAPVSVVAVNAGRHLTFVEAARALGMRQQAFRAIIAAGKGPPVTRLSGGGRLLFPEDALAAWAAERGVRFLRASASVRSAISC